MLNPFRNKSKLPKSAVPSDKESFVYSPTTFGMHPYKFVYYTRLSKIFIEFGGTPTDPKNFYSRKITKYEYEMYKELKKKMKQETRAQPK